jgi:hypothetical protein
MSLCNTIVAERKHSHGYLPVQGQNRIIEEQTLLRSHGAAKEN